MIRLTIRRSLLATPATQQRQQTPLRPVTADQQHLITEIRSIALTDDPDRLRIGYPGRASSGCTPHRSADTAGLCNPSTPLTLNLVAGGSSISPPTITSG